MVPEREVPADELAADTLEQVGDGILAVLRLGEHTLDCVRRKFTARYVNGHGISPDACPRLPSLMDTPLYVRGEMDARAEKLDSLDPLTAPGISATFLPTLAAG